MTYTIACVYSEKTPDDGQRNCPKHVEFYSKNKFDKLVHLVGFIIRIYHDARSPERQITLLLNLRSLVFGLTPIGPFISFYFFSLFFFFFFVL